MKKAILLSNKKIQVIDNNNISILKKNQYLVKVKAAGICSSDITRGFNNGAYNYPLVMGHEFSGIISKCGKNVSKFKIGDKVAIFPLLPCFKCSACKKNNYANCIKYSYYGSSQDGGFSEYININEWNLIKISKKIDFENAALLEPLAVVINTLNKVDLKPKKIKYLSVIGTGFLGLLILEVIKMQKNKNMIVHTYDRNQFKLKIASQLTDKAFLLKGDKFVFTNEHKYDYTIETTGSPTNYGNSIIFANDNSKVIWMSNIADTLKLPQNLTSMILRKSLMIEGVWNSFFKKKEQDDWKTALKLLEKGLKPKKFITHYTYIDLLPNLFLKIHNHKIAKCKIKFIKSMLIFKN